jgi:hypothetical protein
MVSGAMSSGGRRNDGELAVLVSECANGNGLSVPEKGGRREGNAEAGTWRNDCWQMRQSANGDNT